MSDLSTVWVFSGTGSRFSSGVFADKNIAMEWISKHKLSGVLTEYPLGQGVYDWAIVNGLFEIKKEHETSPEFIQQFTPAIYVRLRSTIISKMESMSSAVVNNEDSKSLINCQVKYDLTSGVLVRNIKRAKNPTNIVALRLLYGR